MTVLSMAELSADQRYAWLARLVIPRPIALVATLGPHGIVNIAPFSFFNAVAHTPPTIGFSIGPREAGPKDTLLNLREYPYCVVHLATEALLPIVEVGQREFPRHVSEAAEAGVCLVASDRITVPRLADAAIALECRLSRIVDIGAGPEMTHHCLAEVLHMVIDDRVVGEGTIDLKLLQPIGRLDRGGYCRVEDRFVLPRSV